MAIRTLLPFEARERPPVSAAYSYYSGLRFAVGSEEVVVAPYGVWEPFSNVFTILLRREGDTFVPVKPVERVPLIAAGGVEEEPVRGREKTHLREKFEIGVDVYRASDVPDDVIAVLVCATKQSLSQEASASVDIVGVTDWWEERRLLAWLGERFPHYKVVKKRVLRTSPAVCELEHKPELRRFALRLPAGSEYLLLPEVRNALFTFLFTPNRVGEKYFWHTPEPLYYINFNFTLGPASIKVYRPPPSTGHAIVFFTQGELPTDLLERQHDVGPIRVLDANMPPGSEKALAEDIIELLWGRDLIRIYSDAMREKMIQDAERAIERYLEACAV